MPALATSGGGGYKTAKPKAPKRPAPARSNKGGATRGKARAAQVQAQNKARKTGVTKAVKGPKRVAKATPRPTTQQAASVGLNAYRDYANSMTNLARTGIRPASGPISIPNPIDALGQGLSSLGQVVRDAFGNVVPQDILIRQSAERIRDATRR